MEFTDICRATVKKFGEGVQLAMVFEEMAELQKELCKDLRGKGDWNYIAEEVADVEIMLGQVKEMFKIHDDVEGWKIKKLARLEKML
jgi:hypothetical protein